MARQHGKDTVVKLNAVDISPYTNSTTFNRSADTHDTTTYGVDDHEFSGGLKGGTVTIGGFYDTTAVSGPGASIEPQLGNTVDFVYQISGTGSGKPQKTCEVVVAAYNESSPVADYATWTAELTVTGAVDATAQAV
jgi:hypothetical protein